VSIWLAYEAVQRLLHPAEDVDGPLMSGIATIGVIVNIVLAFVLGEDHVHMPGAHSHDHGDHATGGCSSHNHKADEPQQEHSHASHDHKADEPQQEHSHASHDHKADEPQQEHSHTSHDHKADEPQQEHSHDLCHGHPHESHALLGHDHSHSSSENNLQSDELGLRSAPKRNINLHAAYLHVLGDLAQSAAILIAGLVIWVRPDWQIIDPICTLFFCTMVFMSTLNVVRSSIAVLLEEVPSSVSWQKVYEAICNVEGVTDVHDLHIWCISHDEPALSVHCHSSNPLVLHEVSKACAKFGIHHATIQVQTEEGPCTTCKETGCMASHEISDYERRSLIVAPGDLEQQGLLLTNAVKKR
jgi:zinc transporter 2